jgi:hypothetical protein
MTQRVSVSFGPAQEFEFNVHPDDLADLDSNAAREWFDTQFVELECELPSPIGKVLVTGLILSVAQYAGARRFRDQPDWAQQFARCAAALLGRSVIRVDVAGNAIGF